MRQPLCSWQLVQYTRPFTSFTYRLASASYESHTPERALQHVLSQIHACRFNLMQIMNQGQPHHLQFCSALTMGTYVE